MILSWLSRYIGPVSYSLGLLNTRILLMFVCCSLFFLICYLCNDHDLPRFQMIFFDIRYGYEMGSSLFTWVHHHQVGLEEKVVPPANFSNLHRLSVFDFRVENIRIVMSNSFITVCS